jgi:hypothetical protein
MMDAGPYQEPQACHAEPQAMQSYENGGSTAQNGENGTQLRAS